MNYKKILNFLFIEILILIIVNPIINYIQFNKFVSSGSYGLFAPLMFYGKIYSNSFLFFEGIKWTNLFIDLIILIGIAVLLSFKPDKKGKVKIF
jgi:hypothetical protein